MVITGLTYNLKYPEQTGPHAWATRRALVAAVLREARAHVVGTQEGHREQLEQVADDAGYEWVGAGRDHDGGGEHCAVLYDPSVLTLVDHGDFWLSDSPDVAGSVGHDWGNTVVRMATWVRFRLPDGTSLSWLNTHLDHESDGARRRSAELVVRRLAELAPQGPVVVSGDFNCTPGSAPYHVLTGAGLADAWCVAGRTEHGTFGDWGPPGPDGERIDWVLTRGVAVRSARICDLHDGDRWPSDHVPVRVELDVRDAETGTATPTDRSGA